MPRACSTPEWLRRRRHRFGFVVQHMEKDAGSRIPGAGRLRAPAPPATTQHDLGALRLACRHQRGASYGGGAGAPRWTSILRCQRSRRQFSIHDGVRWAGCASRAPRMRTMNIALSRPVERRPPPSASPECLSTWRTASARVRKALGWPAAAQRRPRSCWRSRWRCRALSLFRAPGMPSRPSFSMC